MYVKTVGSCLDMQSESEIKLMLRLLYEERERIEREVPAGDCHWRINNAKIEILHWVLDEQ